MYGMVNQAVKEMVIKTFDESTWLEICEKANLKEHSFDSFTQYDDSITTDLVGIICEKSGMEPAALLEAFGRFWVSFAQESEYKSILEGFATSPIDLIESLDSLHTRLELTFDNLMAPSFWISGKTDTSVIVHYKSRRNLGLESFVVGLIKGIFNMFDQECTVEIIEPQNNESAVFRVRF